MSRSIRVVKITFFDGNNIFRYFKSCLIESIEPLKFNKPEAMNIALYNYATYPIPFENLPANHY